MCELGTVGNGGRDVSNCEVDLLLAMGLWGGAVVLSGTAAVDTGLTGCE